MTGIGVLINRLSGNRDSAEAAGNAIGKTISSISLEAESLIIRFDDNTGVRVFDDGQSCCEQRYMCSDGDTDWQFFSGAKLTGLEVKDAPEIPDDYGAHEVSFLEVHTSKGVLTLSNHNVHNGYYGGFSISVAPIACA